jgi:oligopeptide/dipeptide ABC transporter ATP-binding protein
MPTPHDTVSSNALPLLRVRGLTASYRSSKQQPALALRGLDFDIAPGEIVGILGESGSGKSTLALSILGLLPANAQATGSVVFQEQELIHVKESGWRAIRGAQIALIFQEPALSLSPVMRVGDQIAEVMRAHLPSNRKRRELECKALLKEVRLDDVDRIYAAYPHQLSGGELHRVAIAQALACRPKLVIADEPTRSLDASVQAEVMDVLREGNRKFGSALIFITHNPALLAGFADRVLVMYAGKIVEDGPVSRVFRRPLHPYTKGLLQLLPEFRQREGGEPRARLPVIPGSLTDKDLLTPGCTFEPRCPARTAICRGEFPDEVVPEPGCRVSCFNHAN